MGKKIDELFIKALDAAKTKRKETKTMRDKAGIKRRQIAPTYMYPAQKILKLAKVKGTWYYVERYSKDPNSWKEDSIFFFGPGSGFDISRIAIKANDFESAMEHAENKYPHLFFTKTITNKQFRKLEEDPGDGWESDPENYRFIESKGKWGLPEQDIRIAGKVEEYIPTAVQSDDHSREAILPDGRKVEYA